MYAWCLGGEGAQEFGNNVLELGVGGVADLAICSDLFKRGLFVGLDMGQELLLEFGDLWWLHFVQVAADTAENDRNLKCKQFRLFPN